MSRTKSFVILEDGTVIWDILGADNDDDSDDEDEDDDDTGGDDDEDEDDDSDGDDEDDSEDDEDEEETVESLKKKLADTEEERDRAIRRMKAADKTAIAANKKADQLRDSSQVAKDLAAAQTEIAELKDKLAKASGQDKASIVREAFRDLTTHDWHDPKVAFTLLNLDEVDVDDSGKIDESSLKYAVKQLVKNHAYLVREKGNKGTSASGNNPSRRRRNTLDRKTMERKFPVLASRS